MDIKIINNIIEGLPKIPYRNGIGAYEGVVAHETDDYSDASEEVMYFTREWNNREAFVHFFVDWDFIRQIADIDYVAWGAGHTANQRYVHVELCRTKDRKLFDASYKNYVELHAWLLYRKRLGVSFGKTFVTHRWVSQNLGGTDHVDPDGYLASWGISITKFVEDVAAAYSRLSEPINKTQIIHVPTASLQQAIKWAKNKGASEQFINLAPIYWSIWDIRGGINPVVGYAQSAKETNFGHFTGALNESYNNPCGMKTHDGGANNDASAHQHFHNWEAGVLAHLDHLALYAGAPGYPRKDTLDPRHFPFIRGTAKTVEQLGGKWAPSSSYGVSIVNDFMKPLEATAEPSGNDWKQEAMQWLKDNKLIVDEHEPDSQVTWAELGEVLKNLKGGESNG